MSRLISNFECVLLVDHNCIVVPVYEGMIFLFCVYFSLMMVLNVLYCIGVGFQNCVSCWENLRLINCFCFVIIA